MKKFVALMLAVLLVMVNIAALAAPNRGDAVEESSGTATEPTFIKIYKMEGDVAANAITYTEELEFTVAQDKTTFKVDSPKMITVGTGTGDNVNKVTVTVQGSEKKTEIPINLSAAEYTQAGVYEYTITEKTPTTPVQGATYTAATTPQTVHVRVYVTWEGTGNDRHLVPTANVWVTGDMVEKKKSDNIENTYNVGSLTVSKKIDGNLADPAKPFTIKVKFAATNTVKTGVTIVAGTSNSDTAATSDTTIAATALNGKEVTLTLCGGDSYTFQDIPYGVTYTVLETITTANRIADEAEVQIANANDPEKYYVSGEVSTATAISKATDSVEVLNKKYMTTPTGITLETLPYVLIMAIAMAGAVVLFARKREEY